MNSFLADKTSAQLKDLQRSTMYEVQLEAYKKRRDETKNGRVFIDGRSILIDLVAFFRSLHCFINLRNLKIRNRIAS